MILCIDNDIDKESYLDIHDFLIIKSRILCLEKLGKDIPMTFLWSKPIQPRRFFFSFFFFLSRSRLKRSVRYMTSSIMDMMEIPQNRLELARIMSLTELQSKSDGF